MLHIATTVLHENSIKKKSDNASKCHLKIPPNPKWNSPSQRRFDLNRITKTKTGEIVVSLLSPITLRPSFSVAINIPLCCLSQNYRNSNRGNTYIYIYIWSRETNSRQFATRIGSQTPFNAIPPPWDYSNWIDAV